MIGTVYRGFRSNTRSFLDCSNLRIGVFSSSNVLRLFSKLNEDNVVNTLKKIVFTDGTNLHASPLFSHIRQEDNKQVIYLNLSKEYRKIKSRIVDEFKALGQEADIDVKLAPKEADSEKSRTGKNLSGIKRIIAVSSCKGGVGKSSVAVNLAYSLHKYLGKKVGIFDADIHGPSIPTMLKKERATLEALENDPKTIIPIEYEGVKTMSYGYASQNNRAVIRGLMATQVLMQLLTVIFSEKNLPSR